MSEYGDEDEEELDSEDEEYEERNPDVSVGGRVQLVESSGIQEGVLEAVVPAKSNQRPDNWYFVPETEPHDWEPTGRVKWDIGITTEVRLSRLDPVDSPIERKFRLAVTQANAEMNKHLEDASEALRKAVEVAEKYGVPFDSNISPIGNTYSPESVRSLHPKVSTDFIDSLTGTYDEENYEYGGWKHSAAGC